MKRLALVLRTRSGSATELREAYADAPFDNLGSLGILSIEAFVGSDYYVLTLECEDVDFQATMHRFFDEPAVQEFLDRLRPFVYDLPARGQGLAAGDTYHVGGAAATRPTAAATVTTAELPLAASIFRWTAGGGESNGRD